MSDLSRVLGDLYGENEPAADGSSAPSPRARFQATAPDWAAEDRLDEAFASWTPGPPADAPAAERAMSVVIDTPDVPAARLDEDIAATLSAALVDAGRDNEVEVPMASAPGYALPTHDDEPLPLSPPPVEDYLPASGAQAEPTWAPEPYPQPYAELEPEWESEWTPEPEPSVASGRPVTDRPWSRSDDDIVPGRVATPKGKRTNSAKAPKPSKLPKAPKAKKAPKPEKAPKPPKVKTPKVKAPKAEKPAKPAGDGPRTFLGIQLTFRRSQ